jgi:hypothetical protein
MKVLNKRGLLLKVFLAILILIALLCGWFTYLIWDEMDGNDSLPTISSNNIKMEKVNDIVVTNNLQQMDSNCSSEEEQKTLELIKNEYPELERDFPWSKCQKFITLKGNFYDVFPGLDCRKFLFLEQKPDEIESVIKNGSNREHDGYPCNTYTIYKVNEDGVNITFSGWQNPQKTLRLTIN